MNYQKLADAYLRKTDAEKKPVNVKGFAKYLEDISPAEPTPAEKHLTQLTTIVVGSLLTEMQFMVSAMCQRMREEIIKADFSSERYEAAKASLAETETDRTEP